MLSGLALIGIACFVLVVVLFRRNDKNQDLYTFGGLSHSANVWNIIPMITVAAIFGGALSSESVGFFNLFTDVFAQLFAGRSPYVFALIVCIAACVLTNIISNAVTLALMTPLSYSFAAAMGINPVPSVLMIIFGAATGMILPSSSAAGAILNANTEWIKLKDIILYGGIAMIAFILACAIFGIPYAGLIFG
jgi:di/tricarboxylate transporter